MIFITSDLHMFHDRKFIYEPRGFSSVDEMMNYYINDNKFLTFNDILVAFKKKINECKKYL